MKKIIFVFSLLSILNFNNYSGYCDIKGSVINPGVYEIKDGETINDVIKKAGGLKKDSYTDNINLSKLVTDEMVIYINSKEEIRKITELNNCDCSPIIKYIECKNNIFTTTSSTTTTKPIIYEEKITSIPATSKSITSKIFSTTTTEVLNKKININICSIEDLISLNGLGESKAKSIIEYREINGDFVSIEDLLKVDGIGKKTFENIKDFIEV